MQYKLITFVYKCLQEEAPNYLISLIEVKNTGRVTRSSDRRDLAVTKVCNTFSGRTFSVKGLQSWNTLPTIIRDSDKYETFKTKLRTHLFLKAINNGLFSKDAIPVIYL